MSSSNKIACHTRSISLPTRSHPLAAAVEAQLYKLRSSDLSSSISNNLVSLKDLYEGVEVEATTLAVFESVLSFLSAPKESNWALVSKFTTKRSAQQVVTEVTKVDVALKCKVIEAKEVQKPLASLK